MKKCHCSCGCQLTENDGMHFERTTGEPLCFACDKGYRSELGIRKEVCQKCGKHAFGMCDDCGFLCKEHDAEHRHETGHITISPMEIIR